MDDDPTLEPREVPKRELQVSKELWDALERSLLEHRGKGTALRTNLVPDGERDRWGYLKHRIPSDRITEGEIFDICKQMHPDFDFDEIQVNKFKNHRECQMHYDKNNVGESRFAMCGPFKGGALRLEGGKKFDQQRVWYQYNGATTRHGVAPFRGTRLSLVLYKRGNRMCTFCDRADLCAVCLPGHECLGASTEYSQMQECYACNEEAAHLVRCPECHNWVHETCLVDCPHCGRGMCSRCEIDHDYEAANSESDDGECPPRPPTPRRAEAESPLN